MDILIVEDEMISRNMLKKMLEQMGHYVIAAEDGRQAWELFQKHSIRIVISDWMMPHMDGLELCRKIRSINHDTYTYIIILTAKDAREDLLYVFQSGADDYIPKPFDPEELRARVQTSERVIDLEDRHRRLQQTLLESRNKLKIVFDSLEEEIIAVDAHFNVVSANRALMKKISLDGDALIGLHVFEDDRFLVSCFEGKKIRNLLMDTIDQKKSQYHFNASNDEKGELRYHHLSFLPVKDESGSVFQVVIVLKDITEDRKKSEKIEKLNAQLIESSAQIEKKNQKLEQMIHRLEQTQAQIIQSEKMASIGQLAAGVAHEINNPTGFVSSNLKTLQDYQKDIAGMIEMHQGLLNGLSEKMVSGNVPLDYIKDEINKIRNQEESIDLKFILEDIRDLINDCREGTDRIKKIVMDLKDFAHPGEDKITIADINQGIESTLNVVSNELKYKASVNKDLGDIPPVKGYPQQLNQVFMNILINAAQAIESRGEIAVRTRKIDSFVEISISDTGKGIETENLPKIFDPFFTTKPVGKGTGLGMNIAYNIIKKHNGTIAVESKVGKGTVFTIRLPSA